MPPDTLARLIALDAALAGDGLRVRQYAREMGFSEKSVRRDIDLLRSFGVEITQGDPPDYVRRYRRRLPLFTARARSLVDADYQLVRLSRQCDVCGVEIDGASSGSRYCEGCKPKTDRTD